jgi:hypothetical protein
MVLSPLSSSYFCNTLSRYFVPEDDPSSSPATSQSSHSLAPNLSRQNSLGGVLGAGLGPHANALSEALDHLTISSSFDDGQEDVSSGDSDDDTCMIVQVNTKGFRVLRVTQPECGQHVSQGVHLGERDASDDDAPICTPASSAAAASDDDDADAAAVSSDNLPEWLRGGMRTTDATPKKTPRKKSRR